MISAKFELHIFHSIEITLTPYIMKTENADLETFSLKISKTF